MVKPRRLALAKGSAGRVLRICPRFAFDAVLLRVNFVGARAPVELPLTYSGRVSNLLDIGAPR
eukprot:12923077-Prorocentrum_lima.AAC.1